MVVTKSNYNWQFLPTFFWPFFSIVALAISIVVTVEGKSSTKESSIFIVDGSPLPPNKPSSTKFLNKVEIDDYADDELWIEDSSSEFAEHRLAKWLLRDYVPWARPCRNCSEPVEVSMEFSLMQINGLDEKTQVLTTTGWLTVIWYDDKLKWDPLKFGNITTIEIPANRIWVPIFGLDNHARMLYDPTFRSEFFVRVDFTGNVHWDVGNQFVSSCSLKLFYYPWDRQACVLSFQSYSHTAKKLRIYASKSLINLEDFTPNGEWNISNSTACSQLSIYDVSSPDGFWSVHFEIQLNRKPKFYITHMITPCIVLAVLVFIVFWLPPEAGEKISLAMTILLSFSVFLLMIAENMPKTSDSVPLVAIYLASFMAASAISIVLSVWVIRCYYHDQNCKSRSTGNIGRNFIRTFAFLVDVDSKTVEEIIQANDNSRRLGFKSPSLSKSESLARSSPVVEGLQPLLLDGNTTVGEQERSSSEEQTIMRFHANVDDIRSLTASIRHVRNYYEHSVKRNIAERSCIDEWRLLSRVCDRIFLFLHIALFIGSLFFVGAMFATAPTTASTYKCDGAASHGALVYHVTTEEPTSASASSH